MKTITILFVLLGLAGGNVYTLSIFVRLFSEYRKLKTPAPNKVKKNKEEN